jgi:hypothetical protein
VKLIIFLLFLFGVGLIPVNAESTTDISQNLENYSVFWTQIIAYSTIVVGTVTAITLVTTYLHQKKRDQISALMEILNSLGNDERRNKRRKTYQANEKYKELKDISVFRRPEYYPSVSATLSYFNQIAVITKKKIIPKNEFFDLYADTVFYCWESLQAHIENEQKKRNNKFYMNHFVWLAQQAKEYWLKNRPNEKIPKLKLS